MKRLLAVILIILLLLSFTGCFKTKDDTGINLFGEMPENYTLEDAKNDGYLVMENGDVTCGQEAFDAFLDKTKNGGYALLRIADYYELPDSSHYSEEYYEEIKNNYPVMYIRNIVYENGIYKEFSYEDGKLMVREFKYLIEDHFEALSETSTYTGGVAFFLCDRDDVSYHDVFRSYFSSNAHAFIPFSIIYQLNNYKN